MYIIDQIIQNNLFTFPALQCTAATFLASILSQSSTSSQKGRITSMLGGL